MPFAAEIWEQLDHHLVKEKWFAANEELREEIAREVNQIYSKNRGNLNSAVIPSEILEMKLRKIDEWAKRKYSIYCEVWLLQGNEISPVFVRTVYAMDIRRLIDQRGALRLMRLRVSLAELAKPSEFQTRGFSHLGLKSCDCKVSGGGK